jgi:hypothetical protein
LRSSKFDPRRQPGRPAARRGVALRKIVAGLLLAAAAIFLASVIGGLFR